MHDRAQTLRDLAETIRDKRFRADPFEPASDEPGDVVYDLNSAARREVSDDEFRSLILRAEAVLRFCDEQLAKHGDMTTQVH